MSLCAALVPGTKYAEPQRMAFRCHHCHLTLHFSCSRLHYCAAGPTEAVTVCETDLCRVGYCTRRAVMLTKGCQADCQTSRCRSSASIGCFGGDCVRMCMCPCVCTCVHPSFRTHGVTAERDRTLHYRNLFSAWFSHLPLLPSGLPPSPSARSFLSPSLMLLFEVVTNQHSNALVAPLPASQTLSD